MLISKYKYISPSQSDKLFRVFVIFIAILLSTNVNQRCAYRTVMLSYRVRRKDNTIRQYYLESYRYASNTFELCSIINRKSYIIQFSCNRCVSRPLNLIDSRYVQIHCRLKILRTLKQKKMDPFVNFMTNKIYQFPSYPSYCSEYV